MVRPLADPLGDVGELGSARYPLVIVVAAIRRKMFDAQWINVGLLILFTVCNAVIAIDSWVHRHERREDTLAADVKSLMSSIATEERIRMERVAHMDQGVAEIKQDIKQLHERASDHLDVQQRKIGVIELDLVKLRSDSEYRQRSIDDLNARVSNALMLLDRRAAFESRTLGERRNDQT